MSDATTTAAAAVGSRAVVRPQTSPRHAAVIRLPGPCRPIIGPRRVSATGRRRSRRPRPVLDDGGADAAAAAAIASKV